MASVYVVAATALTSYVAKGSAWSSLAAQGSPVVGTIADTRAICYDGTRVVIGGASGQIAWSTTGNAGTWTQVDTGITGDIRVLVQHGGRTIALSSSGDLATTTDVTGSWTATDAEFGTRLFHEAVSNGTTIVAVGDAGTVYTSPTGLSGSWTAQTLDTFPSSNAISVEYSSTLARWVIGGQGGRTWYSDDTVTWSYAGNPSARDVQAIVWGSGVFVQHCGTSGGEWRITTSFDGENWTGWISGPDANLPRDAIYDSDRSLWVVCGNDGEAYTGTNPLALSAVTTGINTAADSYQVLALVEPAAAPTGRVIETITDELNTAMVAAGMRALPLSNDATDIDALYLADEDTNGLYVFRWLDVSWEGQCGADRVTVSATAELQVRFDMTDRPQEQAGHAGAAGLDVVDVITGGSFSGALQPLRVAFEYPDPDTCIVTVPILAHFTESVS